MTTQNTGRVTDTEIFPVRLRLKPHKLQRNKQQVEKAYLQDLQMAREAFGQESAYTGVVLLQLQEFYESQGLMIAAEKVEKEARNILCSYGKQMGLLPASQS